MRVASLEWKQKGWTEKVPEIFRVCGVVVWAESVSHLDNLVAGSLIHLQM